MSTRVVVHPALESSSQTASYILRRRQIGQNISYFSRVNLQCHNIIIILVKIRLAIHL